MDFIRNFLQFPSVSVSMPKKLPKFKKIRQWSHDSLANLSQLTNRVSNNEKPNQDGISTISSAIREQNFDPKKDNFGLYALKCDRSRSAVNAKRGILLNLPSSSTTTKLKGSGSFQTVDRNHEVFKSCEVVDDDENLTTKFNQKALKIVPPPRKKKKPNLHHKPQQKINKAGHGTITAAYETLERNDSGLYKIVNSTETAKITFVEPRVTAREMKSVTAFVKPKIEKAVVVKSTSFEGKREIFPKIRDYEWSKQQRRPSHQGSLNLLKKDSKFAVIKKSASVDPIAPIDIFKSNRLIDQKKLFDEFDELFEKNNKNIIEKRREEEDEEVVPPKSPSFAFRRLNELKKFPSSSFSISTDESEDKKEMKLINATTATIPDFNLNSTPSGDLIAASKPKIISEQVKHVQRKILYYDDEREMQELVTRRMSNEDSKSQKSNSLRIFSNDGIFVFNL